VAEARREREGARLVPARDGVPAGAALVTEAELAAWGRAIGSRAEPPLWLALVGELGAGKSVLARAVCEGAGVRGWVPSPTFVLANVYRSPRGFPVWHVDLYRLERPEELQDLAWRDLLGVRGLVCVEWADRARDRWPDDVWEVRLEHVADPALRRVVLRRHGAPRALPPLPGREDAR
jgi:tRNA threonylcarbamoyladenosine biosynthesis protein TsaE